MSVTSVLTLHALRRWMFNFAGGYCIGTFYHQSVDYVPPPPTVQRQYVFMTRHVPPSLGGQEELMLHVQENQFAWGIALALVTVAGGWFAVAGSGVSFAAYGAEGRIRMEKVFEQAMDYEF